MLQLLQRYIPSLKVVSLRDRAFLARQLATMLDSGLPLAQALSILGVQCKNEVLKEALAAIVHDIEHGFTFSGAIAKHPKIFNRVFVAAVRSGEASGKLDTVLDYLANQLEKETEIVGKVRGAMLYPIFIIIVMIAVVVIMLVKVVPQLKEVFAENGAELPWTTQAVIYISNSMIHYWWVYIVAVAFAIYGIRFYLHTDDGRAWWNGAKIKMPVFGNINQGIVMARFTRTLGMLISSGVPIIEALRIVAEVIDNDIYREGLRTVANEVARGIPMSVPLNRNKNFPVIVSQMSLVGEQTGKMDEVFNKLARYYEQQTDEMVKGIAALVEPVILVIIGVGVAFVVFSIIMPLYNLSSQIN